MTRTSSMALTGATGLLGNRFCEYFRARGWDVRALVRNPSTASFRAEGVRIHRCELPDRIDREGLEGAQVLVHCAATTRSDEVAAAGRIDEQGARNLFEAARAAGVARRVFLSSTSAREDAPSHYGRTKVAIEGMLDPERDLVLRLGLVLSKEGAGLFERMVGWVSRSRLVPVLGGGRQCAQPVHIDDVCLALERALSGGFTGTLVVADPEGIAYRRLLGEIAERLDRRSVFVPVPYAPVLWSLRLVEACRIRFPVTADNVLGLRAQRFVSSAADWERLGLQPRTTEEALDDVLGPRGAEVYVSKPG